MKTHKFVFVAALVAALLIAACGGDDSDDTAAPEAPAAETDTTESDAAGDDAAGDDAAGDDAADGDTAGDDAADDAAPEPTGDPIKIGVSIPLSGAIALPQIVAGYEAAIDDVNAAGGIAIDGEQRPVELIVRDNRSDLNTMTDQIRGLALEDEVSALLGACCQYNVSAIPLIDSLQVPFVWGALPVELAPPTQGYSWGSFQTLVDAATQYFDIADTVETNKTVAFVANNDGQGTATLAGWSALGESRGYTFAVTEAVPVGTTDFSAFIQSALDVDADLLIAGMTPPDCFALWKQLEALEYQPELAVGLQCAQTPGWNELASTGDGTLSVLHWTPDSGLPGAESFVERFGDDYPTVVDLAAVPIGYHQAEILLTAIAAAGSTDREAINEALAATDIASSLGPVAYDERQLSVTPTFYAQWGGGDARQVWPVTEGVEPVAVPVAGLQ
ncbi:MAG: ABC transporter substrate-binding protein [Acidimicrobiales bacterium]